MEKNLRILIVEDSEYDVRIIVEILKHNQYQVEYINVFSAEKMHEVCKNDHFNLIISDYTMPDFDGIQALGIAKSYFPDVPFVIVSGTIGEETAVNAMKSGASDYIMKDNLKKLVPAVKNIMEKVRIKKELKEVEIKYAHLFNSMLEAIFVTDTSRNVINVNPQFLVLFGYSMDEVLYKPTKVLFKDKKDYFDIGKKLADLGEEKLTINILELVKKDGSSFIAEARSYPMYNAKGVSYGVITLFRDVTESKRMEAELISAKEKAEESDRLKSAFMDNMSHEVRTPLNAIIGFSQLLSMPDLQTEEKEEFISLINSRGNDLVRIISDILEISKIQAGSIELSTVPCNLNNLLNDIKQKLEASPLKKERPAVFINLQNELKSDINLINTDIEKLRLILFNLIENALKYTPDGQIDIQFQPDATNKDCIAFSIKDNGIGIPAFKLPIIFDVFRQVDDSHTRIYGGTGLGLSICKSLIEKLGGEIQVKSQEGVGTEVSFTIPHNKTSDFSHKDDNGYPDWSATKILVVEDNSQNYLFIEMVIKNTGIQIEWAKDGKQAIDIMQKTPDFDLILMDLQLPKMSGIEVTKIFRDQNVTCPIIAQTAFSIPEHFNEKYQIEFDDYLQKPYKKEILIQSIHKQLFGE
ncbi:MAG: response regulator [Bacteroidetes bacterium]|nr:response regulator [Bacteroidota bacterium]